MKVYLTILHLVFLNVIFIAQPSFQWAKSFGGKKFDQGKNVIADNSGNVYILGTFKDTADFDPGPLVYHLYETNTPGYNDDELSLTKLDNGGNLIWAKKIGGKLRQEGRALCFDQQGNICLAGFFEGTIDFDPGIGVFLGTANGYWYYDCFVSKIDTAGNLLWAKTYGGTAWDYVFSMSVDNQGNMIIGGIFQGTVDFDPGPSTFTMSTMTPTGTSTSLGSYILKLDQNGDFLWAQKTAGQIAEGVNAVCTDASGNIYTTGYFTDTTDFDPSSNVYTLTSANNGEDIFISAFTSAGTFSWTKALGSNGYERGCGICVDANTNIFLTGTFHAIADLDPGTGVTQLVSQGGTDIFVAKYDLQGNLIWAGPTGGIYNDNPYSIALDFAGNVYIAGEYSSPSADFDPGLGTSMFTCQGMQDVFFSKLDPNGNLVWAQSIGGVWQERCYSIFVDTQGNVYGTGSFASTTDFYPGIATYTLSPIGRSDQSVFKLSQPSIVGIKTQETNMAEINFFPNPTSDLMLISQNPPYTILKIKLYTSSGELLYENEISAENHTMDVSQYPPGIYLVAIETSDCTKLHKIVKN